MLPHNTRFPTLRHLEQEVSNAHVCYQRFPTLRHLEQEVSNAHVCYQR